MPLLNLTFTRSLLQAKNFLPFVIDLKTQFDFHNLWLKKETKCSLWGSNTNLHIQWNSIDHSEIFCLNVKTNTKYNALFCIWPTTSERQWTQTKVNASEVAEHLKTHTKQFLDWIILNNIILTFISQFCSSIEV